ncbi:unnamed protein product [Allacma fusca]|uniref:Uncharacterized protein n=1 Tax=Allacma fusca TaxID=39272 RepID=A0A8J2PRW5_9HEXA|nr:unnamed protein product [Allacma fusca]
MKCNACEMLSESTGNHQLKILQKGSNLHNWNIHKLLTNTERLSRLKDFELKVQNCEWMPEWATDLLTIINIPLEAVYDEIFSVLCQICNFTSVDDLENHSEGQFGNWNEILEGDGIEGFIESLHLRNYFGLHYWCYKLKYYLGKLLKFWKIPGNQIEFVKSQDFLNIFLGIGKIRLLNIVFENV